MLFGWFGVLGAQGAWAGCAFGRLDRTCFTPGLHALADTLIVLPSGTFAVEYLD